MLDEKRRKHIEDRAATTLEQVLAVKTTDDFCTPKWFADIVGEFDMDVCTNELSHIRARERFVFGHELLARECEQMSLEVFDEKDLWAKLVNLATAIRNAMPKQTDGLAAPWVGSLWDNFPYSNPLPWCERHADHDDTSVILAKLDTTTKWWRVLMDAGFEWAPFRARFKFEQPGKSMTANFASVLIWKWWDPPREVQKHLWHRSYGAAA